MKNINFKINRKIEFIYEKGKTGISLIQDVQENDILVTIPMKGNNTNLLSKGEDIEGIYYDEDNVLMFTTEVLDLVTDDNIPLYRIAKPKTFHKIQRRNLVRIPISLPFLYMKKTQDLTQMMKSKKLEEIERFFDNTWQRGNVLDLSGGGMKVSIQSPLKVEEEIFIILKSKELYMGVEGKVKRCVPFVLKEQLIYHIGMEFIDMEENKREEIIRFIFTKLREVRKKDK